MLVLVLHNYFLVIKIKFKLYIVCIYNSTYIYTLMETVIIYICLVKSASEKKNRIKKIRCLMAIYFHFPTILFILNTHTFIYVQYKKFVFREENLKSKVTPDENLIECIVIYRYYVFPYFFFFFKLYMMLHM